MEPFSTVAGAFSVISLAVQLGEKIQEVRDFWRSLEDASMEVADILHELDLVLGILRGVAELDATIGSSNNEALLKALQTCGIYVRRLSACVHDLKSGFAGGRAVRAWTSLRFTLRRERVRTSQGALERVKSCLVLAQMVSQEQARVQDMTLVRGSIACIESSLLEMKSEKPHAAVVRHLSTELLRDISSSFGNRPAGTTQHNSSQSRLPVLQYLPPEEPASCVARRPVHLESADEPRPFYNLSDREADSISPGLTSGSKRKSTTVSLRQITYSTFFANVHHRSTITSLESGLEEDGDNIHKQHRTETSFSVHPKPWLLGRGFALSYITSGNNWVPQLGFQFRHYNIRPRDALIFAFCASNNIEGVKSLLCRGDASPFDTNPEGWTPLHYAAEANNYAICKLLVRHGASGSVLDWLNRSALHLTCYAWPFIDWPRKSPTLLDHMESNFARTVRVLVDHTDVDMNMELRGDTFLDRIIPNTSNRRFSRWLLQKAPPDFDVDHRNRKGRTLLMQQVSRMSDLEDCLNNMKDLLARGAALDARVPEHAIIHPRYKGATALHFAVQFYYHPSKIHFFEKARYLLSQGADPHVKTSTGQTATDLVIELRAIEPFLQWRKILLELGFDLRSFVRAEIDVHADVPWYADNGCDDFVFGMFGFKAKLDDPTDTVRFLTLSEAEPIDHIEPARDGRLSPAEEDESTPNIFNDTDTESEHGSSSETDYQSADENLPRPRWKRTIPLPQAYRTQSQAVEAKRSLAGGLSLCIIATPRGSGAEDIWQAYAAMLETGSLESWAVRDRHQLELRLEAYGQLMGNQSEFSLT